MPTAIQSVTLNKLIEEFYKLADAHEMLESFYYGNFLEIYQSDASNPIAYKTMLMNVNNASIDPNYVILTVELMVMDKVFKDNDDRQDVESDTLAILGDIFSVVSYSNRWQSFCKIGGASTMRKFVNKGEDQVTGWAMTIQLNVKRKNGLCDLPISDYDYEGTYKPYCAGVRIFRDGLLVEVTPSGGRYDYSTGGVAFNIDINGTPFLVGVSTDQDINVLSSQLTALGSKVGDNWIVTDALQTLNGDPITPQIPETTKAIIIQTVDAAPIPVTLITDDALNLVAEVPNAQVNVNGDAFEQVAPGGTLNVPILDTAGNPTGTNIGPNVEVQDSDVLLSSQAVPQLLQPIRSQQAKTISLIDAIDSDPVQVTVATDTEALAEIILPNGTVLSKDSAGTTLYTTPVKSGGTTNRVINDGSVILKNAQGDTLQTYTNKAQEAKVITLPIIYLRPANSGYGTTSYLTGDEGYNELNYPAPASPLIGIPALLDPTDPKKLLYNNAFGNKQRFTGINGGYWDYSTLQYKLADGTVSTEAITFGTIAGSTSYLIDNHTGAAYKWNANGSTTWSTQVTNILGLTHAGFSDYFLHSRNQILSLIAGMNLGSNLMTIKPFNSGGSLKTSTPTFGTETTTHNQLSGLTMNISRVDGTADGAFPMRWHF